MLTTHGRDSGITPRAIDDMLMLAATQRLAPIHLHLGFFNLRDLMRVNDGREVTPPANGLPGRYMGMPYMVAQLDDVLLMCCTTEDGTKRVPITWTREI